ncbi:MAG: RHS repeat-associated core domain-containing protein [Polaromonas sp.]
MPSAMTFGSISGSTIGQGTAGPVERSLAFVYGPEHQRIKQTVVGGPTPGTTWYLNGEDSQGLTYEKETSAGGLIEHKHYASAGGVVFALFVQRTGNLGTQTASATRYFHHDHLGSIAVVTNEAGTVIERMAFDAWGKRRFVNGNTDSLDAITGQTTDRGYTMHEHLDEMGVIHMNGRIYDPLIGRFISRDPIGLDGGPNEHAYVEGNPIAKSDPTGHLSADTTVSVQAQASVMLVMVGGSAAVGQNISTDGKSCTYVQICPRLGFGLFAGAGVGVGAGIGGTGSDVSVSAGGGFDAGFGVTQSAQVTTGPDGVGVSGGRGGWGMGAGISVGADLCIQIPINCKQVFCPAK